MPRPFGCALVAAFALAVPALVCAQPFPGLESWVDGCEVSHTDLAALLEDEAVLVDTTRLLPNPDGSYRLLRQPFSHLDGQPDQELCPDAQFAGQSQVVDGLFRSAVQVGPDLVLTAWHGAFTMGTEYRVVLGIHDRVIGDACFEADFDHIPASNVYVVTEAVADGYANQGTLDMLLLRVDRAIDGQYPRVRRSGRGWPGDASTVVGHPEKMAAKVDLAGQAGGVVVAGGQEWLQFANHHVMDASSGSMVFNRTQRLLETVVRTGVGVGLEGPSLAGCYYLSHLPGFRGHNASLRHFARNIPAYELVVHNLDPVVLDVPAGQEIEQASARSVKTPLTAASSLSYQIVPPGESPPGEPTLTIAAAVPDLGTLAPGQSFSIQQTASTSGSSCGIYERSYEVRDLTNGFVDVARHVFEIGVLEMQVSGGLAGGVVADVAAPFENTIHYTLANPRSTAVTVSATANRPWVTLDGQGSPLVLTIPPHDDVEVTVGFASSLASEGHGTHPVAVTFAVVNPGNCPASPPFVASFDFVYGRESFRFPGSVSIPNGSPDGIQLDLTVPETFTLCDVNVTLAGTVAGDQLIAKLVSPGASRRTIWNHGGGSGFDNDPPFGVLLDDQNPPHPYQPLSVLNGEAGGGEWHLMAADDVPGGAGGQLTEWSLHLSACPLED